MLIKRSYKNLMTLYNNKLKFTDQLLINTNSNFYN